jgi:hypothetical protein
MKRMQIHLHLLGLVFIFLASCSQVSTSTVEPAHVDSNTPKVSASHPDSEDSKVDLPKGEGERVIQQGIPKIQGASDNRPLPGKRKEPTDFPQSKASSSIG